MSNPIEALVALGAAAAARERHETSDSWLEHGGAARARDVLAVLCTDPAIDAHLQPGNFLHVLGATGIGMQPEEAWLRGFLRILLSQRRELWAHEAEGFINTLRAGNGHVSAFVRTTLPGVALVDEDELQLAVGRLYTALRVHFYDLSPNEEVPAGVVYEYETDLPATVSSAAPTWPAEEVAAVEREHQRRLTRLLLALALTTEGPVQEHLVMREVRYSGGAGGQRPDALGPIVVGWRSALDATRAAELRGAFAELDGVELGKVGVATRRFLLARTERVRPADQVVDYAIALESMSGKRYGREQGEELARVIADDVGARAAIERGHQRFRKARELIVHEGEIPANVAEAATLGRDLVRRSLVARTRRS